MTAMTSATDPNLTANWKALVSLGPRVAGSQVSSNAVRLLTRLLDDVDETRAPRVQAFQMPGWIETSEPELALELPTHELVPCCTCLWSPSTPSPVEGLLRRGGEFHWLGFEWRDYLLTSDGGGVLAHVVGRLHGPAIRVPVPAEVRSVPPDDPVPLAAFVVCGDDVILRIDERLQTEAGIPARIQVQTSTGFTWISHNIIEDRALSLDPERSVVLVCAHYDTTIDCPGADDDASGIAVALALAASLKNRSDVVYAFFGAEEWNMWGSRSYVHHLKVDGLMGRIRCVLNLDGVSEGTGLVVRAGPIDFGERLRPVVDRLAAYGLCRADIEPMPCDVGDHWPFLVHSIPSIWLTQEGKRHYHASTDTCRDEDIHNMEAALRIASAILHSV